MIYHALGGCVLAFLFLAGCQAASSTLPWHIKCTAGEFRIHSDLAERRIARDGDNVASTRLAVAGENLLDAPCPEMIVRFRFADPNREPRGMTLEEASRYKKASEFDIGVRWVEPIVIRSDDWAEHFEAPVRPDAGDSPANLLMLRAKAKHSSPLAGVTIGLTYQAHDGHPAIRKRIEVTNESTRWLIIDQLTIDPLRFGDGCAERTPLTPSERGAGSSVVAFSDANHTRGVIAVSETPSALRDIGERGAMGYADEHFEWVLGPGESFDSEWTFVFPFDGERIQTPSAVSTPLDRTVEGPYMRYLENVVGVVAAGRELHAPTWCTWSNMAYNIDDAILRRQVDLAARCGFKMLLIDDGWQRDRHGTEPHPEKFPDFAATAAYIRSKGLALGLWVSCYRSPDSPDLREHPNGRSLPLHPRGEGYCMSFASEWRNFYAADLVGLHRDYGALFFKQDFTNIKYGDIAAGHESRTAKESLLRGLRGLLASQDLIRENAGDVLTQLSHEIYWGTPGVPCDVAMIKHAGTYHMPPNDYGGAGHRREHFDPNWDFDPDSLRKELLGTCFNARRRIYEHRGLPAYALEYYGAHTVNLRGSLTPAVQDRQVCSWLGGCPKLFAGDLRSLTDEHIAHYRRRFDLLERLQGRYGIYRRYQFSGVPRPTDTDWHWWGKLDDTGAGVVVVIRGAEGEPRRRINIPWGPPGRRYKARALLAERDLGDFSSDQLQSGALELDLPPMGQEIIELAPLDR